MNWLKSEPTSLKTHKTQCIICNALQCKILEKTKNISFYIFAVSDGKTAIIILWIISILLMKRSSAFTPRITFYE